MEKRFHSKITFVCSRHHVISFIYHISDIPHKHHALTKYIFFLQGLISELISNCDGTLKAEVTQLAAHYEHRIQLGSKAIYHLEAFVAKFMSIYKRFLEEGMADFF